MYEMGVWKYEMTKRMLDITHQASVLTHIAAAFGEKLKDS